MNDLYVRVPFGATRPDGVTVNRIGGEFVEASPADILAAVRTLPGVEEVDSPNAAIKSHPHNGPGVYIAAGRYLVVPVSASEDAPHAVCITKDGRNLHDEGYCDVTGQDYNDWRG